MKKLFYLAVLACLPLFFTGCEKRVINTGVTIHGNVYDATTFDPIQGAIITLQPGNRRCYSGSDGAFNFEEDLEPKKYTVQAMADGYQPDWTEVILSPGESSKVDLALNKKQQ